MSSMLNPPPLTTNHDRRSGSYRGLGILVFCFGLGLSFLIWHLTQRQINDRQQVRFDHFTEMIRSSLIDRIDNHVRALRGLQAFILSSDHVSRDEWRQYVSTLDNRSFHGSLGYAFVAHIRRDAADAFIAATHADGAPDFALKTSGQYPDLYVVEYIEPLETNRQALGYDIGQEPVRREAANASVESGLPTISSRISLIQDDTHQPGFLLLLPVFRKGLPLETTTQRWQALLGWVDTPIRIDRLLTDLTAPDIPVDFELFEGDHATVANVLFDSDNCLALADDSRDAVTETFERSPLHRQLVIPVAGRQWTLRMVALPGFVESLEQNLSSMLLAGGVLLSLMAALLVNSFGRTLSDARTLAEAMTVDLGEAQLRYRQIVENTKDLITRVDSSGRLLYVNPAAQTYWGIAPADCIGRSAFEFICPEDRQATLAYFDRWLKMTDQIEPYENGQLHRSGTVSRMLWTISATRDKEGRIVEMAGIARDITKLRQDEQLLAAQLQLLREAGGLAVDDLLTRALDIAETLTGSHIGFYHFVNPDQQTLQLQAWSSNTLRNHCRVTGATMHYPIAQAGVWVDCIHKQRPVIHNDYASLAHKKGLPDGHPMVCRELVVPVFRDDKLMAVMGVGNKATDYLEEDISTVQQLADLVWETVSRRQAEEALRESEARFQSMFRSHHATMLLIDPADGRIVDANEAACLFYGYKLAQLTGMNIGDINTLPQPQLEKAMRSAAMNELRGFEFTHRLASGEVREVEVHSSPILVRQKTLLFSIIHDITPRKQAQHSLVASETRYRSLFDEANHGTIVADAETGTILSCNRKLAEMLGWPAEEIIGRPQRCIHPESERMGDFSTTFIAHKNEKSGQPLEAQLLTRDGRIIDVEILASHLNIDGQNLLQGFFYDISERKKLMAEQTRSAQLAAIGTIAAGVAHEINNPIQGIMNYAALIEQKPERPDRNREIATRIINESERIARITQDLLFYARDSQAERIPVEVKTLINSSLTILDPKLRQHGITVACQLPDPLPLLAVQPQRIQQVLINLIDNAYYALCNRNDTRTDRTITISAAPDSADDSGLVIEVRDNGCGMSGEVLARAQEAFFTTKPGNEGTGLGLAIVSDIIKKHSGRIEIDSLEGEYTAVRITLPTATTGPESEATP